MSNMSYCRFENTCNDLEECKEALENGEELSKSELGYAINLLSICQNIVDNYDEESLTMPEEEQSEGGE